MPAGLLIVLFWVLGPENHNIAIFQVEHLRMGDKGRRGWVRINRKKGRDRDVK